MVTVQFQTKVKNGVIQIPRKYRGKFHDDVRVILRAEGKKISSVNYIDKLMTNPVKVKNFQRLTREQIYAR